ncbi:MULTISPECIES: hypothetical protein [unclassified Moorena]|nr:MULTISPECIES: hypothetical protein [unclassified Moorena]
MGRWGDGEMGRWGDGKMGRLSIALPIKVFDIDTRLKASAIFLLF